MAEENFGNDVMLNGENYLQWSYSVQKCLRLHKKLKFLSEDPPNKNSFEYEPWMIENLMVMKWLWNCMEPSVLLCDLRIDTAKKIWDVLKEKYSPEKNVFKIYDLYGVMFNNKQGERSLNEYYNSMKFLWEELIKCMPYCYDSEEQKRHQKQFFVAILLNGLNSEYSVYKDEIFGGSRLPTPAEAYTRLLRKKNEQKNSSHQRAAATTESSGFVSTGTNHSGRGGFCGSRGGFVGSGGRGGGGRSDKKSRHSNKSSHTVDDGSWAKWKRPARHNQVKKESSQNTRAPAAAASSSRSGVTTADSHTDMLREILEKLDFLVSASTVPPVATTSWVNSEYEDNEEYWY